MGPTPVESTAGGAATQQLLGFQNVGWDTGSGFAVTGRLQLLVAVLATATGRGWRQRKIVHSLGQLFIQLVGRDQERLHSMAGGQLPIAGKDDTTFSTSQTYKMRVWLVPRDGCVIP